MLIGPITRSFPLLLASLLAAMAASCNSISQTPRSRDLILAEEAKTPGLSLASFRPSPLKLEDEDKDGWRMIEHGENDDVYARSGLNISVKTTLSDLLGDFDGNTRYQNNALPPDQFLFIPDTDASAGFGIDVGFRWERFEMLFSWQETEYDASFGGAGKDTTISYVDLLFREYFWIDSHIQPFLVAGIGASEGKISGGAQDAGANLSTGELLDGINYNLGAGLAFYVSPRLSVFGQLLYRFGRYESLGTSYGDVAANPNVDSDSWEISTGVSFNLLDPWD